MRINHGGVEVVVAQQLLNRANVIAIFPANAWRMNDEEHEAWRACRCAHLELLASLPSARQSHEDDAALDLGFSSK